MGQVFSTRIWVFQVGRGDDGRLILERVQRLADRIPGAEICLYRDQGNAERYVAFGSWPDHRALQSFRSHPDAECLFAELQSLLTAAYPPESALALEEVMR